MKKIKAFLAAVLMLAVLSGSIHFIFAADNTKKDGMGTWVNMYKDLSYSAVSSNLDSDTVLVMGSSEFQHGRKTEYHPTKVFRKSKTDLMFVGAAYNQCLSHALTLGAVSGDLKSKKAILLLSPAWFDNQGVKPEAFAIRFSETEYLAMLDNPNLSNELKRDLAKRTEELLTADKAIQNNVKRYNKTYFERTINPVDRLYMVLRKYYLTERERVSLSFMWKMKGLKDYERDIKEADGKEPDWEALKEAAVKEFDGNVDNNNFGIRARIYRKKFASIVDKQEGIMEGRKYSRTSPEYKDLELFLRICKETGVTPKFILLPVNGYWYDHTGFIKKERDALPGQIMEVVKKYDYGSQFVSYFNEAYNKGFLEDVFHPAEKGWTEINEEIYKFYKE